ncbi:FAD-dependent oxidoreductase [Natrinema salinisoli]|uniref:FAD-dependent oxidoreductase n=1 Tax=Natrinema salinisoli TaxID=2878535 RepID=UPI001CEFCD45|nr:FAD-dependent oxidoreductase [Natrinema salinisoli]
MPDVKIESITDVGQDTFALELVTPSNFEAHPGQFILVRAEIDGEEETGYYTLSSPDVKNTFEVTVAITPDGTLGPWLVDREVGESITVEGPYGEIQYLGNTDAVVLAEGPGIGPAVGIAERATDEGKNARIIHTEASPPHADRLNSNQSDHVSVTHAPTTERLLNELADVSNEQIYVFGFKGFVDKAKETLEKAGIDPDSAEIESFGPK